MKKIALSILLIISIMALSTGCNSKKVIATLKTNQGDIKFELYTKEAPETTKNFIELAKQNKYDNTIFHRVIRGFMIQGGDFENRNGTGGYSYKGPGTSLEDEFGEDLSHVQGAVSMANSGPDTGGSQFFIVQAPEGATYLDGKHAIFGMIIDVENAGMGVVNAIANSKTDLMDKPEDDVIIEDVIIEGE